MPTPNQSKLRATYGSLVVSLLMASCQQQPSHERPARDAASATPQRRPSKPVSTATPKDSSKQAPAPLSGAVRDELYGLTLTSLDGKAVPFATFRDKAVLVVNTASQCGYTPQYGGLQRLHERFAEKGLVVAGFPCNQFGGQEPGDAQTIRTFCTTRFAVTFPVFTKAKVKGNEQHPLFKVLQQAKDTSGEAGAVRWNFEKFLLLPQGKGVQRFRSGVRPESAELVAAIRRALPKT